MSNHHIFIIEQTDGVWFRGYVCAMHLDAINYKKIKKKNKILQKERGLNPT
jgi:hypothetical protein